MVHGLREERKKKGETSGIRDPVDGFFVVVVSFLHNQGWKHDDGLEQHLLDVGADDENWWCVF